MATSMRLERGDLVVRALRSSRVELAGRDAIGEQRRPPHAGAPLRVVRLPGCFFTSKKSAMLLGGLPPNFCAS